MYHVTDDPACPEGCCLIASDTALDAIRIRERVYRRRYTERVAPMFTVKNGVEDLYGEMVFRASDIKEDSVML